MNSLGLIMVLTGVLLGRQVIVGRVSQTGQDLKDITLNVLSGDFSALSTTLAQRGENAPPDVTNTVAVGTSGGAALNQVLLQGQTGDLLAKVIDLGHKAKGYRLGGTGPDFYDCSGLVWKAMTELGVYSGPRFTTWTFVKSLGNQITQVSSPLPGDIVLWNGPAHGHMGVVSGTDQFFSALSPSNGITFASIKQTTPTIIGAGQPTYYRVTAISGGLNNG